MEEEKIAIGIDLGTTFSVGAYYEKDKTIELFPDESGVRTIASSVLFEDDRTIIGNAANIKAKLYHSRKKTEKYENLIIDAKRMIGRRWEDETVQNFKKQWDFEIVKGDELPSKEHDIKIKVNKAGSDVYLKPYEVSALVLQKIVSYVKAARPRQIVDNVVITVPAYFGDAERQATIAAAEIAGLNVLNIINEPTAAAIALASTIEDNQEKRYLIFDLGGGTFDVSIVKVNSDDGFITGEVLATDGDAALGGRDFDRNLLNHVIQKYKEENDGELPPTHMQKLKDCIEEHKKLLSREDEVMIEVWNWSVTVARSEFENINRTYFEKCETVLKRVFDNNKNRVTIEGIDEVMLVGGSTYIPKIKEIVEKFTKKEAHRKISPEYVVAHGAAIHASSILSKNKKFTLSDIVAHDIGVEVDGREMSVIVKRGTSVPTSKDGEYIAAQAGQKAINLKVLQGNNELSKDNDILAQGIISGFSSNSIRPRFTINIAIDKSQTIITTVKCHEDPRWEHKSQVETIQNNLISPEIIMKAKERHKVLFSPESPGTKEATVTIAKTTEATTQTNISSPHNQLKKILECAETLAVIDKVELKKIQDWHRNCNGNCMQDEAKLKIDQVLLLAGDFRGVLEQL